MHNHVGKHMMKDFTQFFEKFEKSNPIPLLYEEGLTHSQVKEFVIVLFKPFFKNHDFFKKNQIDIYLDTWINFFSFRTKQQFDFTQKIIEFYNKALSIDEKYTLETTIEYRDDFAEGLSKFWSFLNSERKQSDFFEIEDYHNYILQSLGLVIEGASKPLLKELFQLNKFIKGNKVSKETVNSYDLGVLVDYLEHTDFKELFNPKPLNIRVSQLRNISYHHNANIQKDGTIKCSYGKGSKKVEFNTTLADLELTLQNVLYYYNAIKLAREIFLWDNYEKIKPLRAHLTETPKLRQEGMVAALYMAISREQFKMVSLKTDDNNAILIVQDLLIGNEKNRAIHSSQFLYNLWWYTDKKNLKVEYKDSKGKTRLTAKTTSEICERIGKGEKELSFMAENVDFDNIAFD
jgi:hypothetical protein